MWALTHDTPPPQHDWASERASAESDWAAFLEIVVENRGELSAGGPQQWCKAQVSEKVIGERPINRSDVQTLRHMFLIRPGSNNIMVEEFTVISRYQRLSL